MDVPGTEKRKKMIASYKQTFEEYNYGLHSSNLTAGKLQRSGWFRENFEEIWIPRKNELLMKE